MNAADPRASLEPTTSFDECDVCEHINRVTYWESTRNGRWERDAYTCLNCEAYHRAIDGKAEDRGASTVAVSLILFGLALVGIFLITHAWPLFFGGAALVVAVWTVGVINYIGRNHQS